MKKMLIVYYSWSNGNTKKIAEALQAATGADIIRIETVTPYPTDYNATVAQGQNEVNAGFLPKIQPLNANLADYGVIAIGTPTWWYTMAPAVATFLHENDFNGKTVIPFMTNGGWPGHVIKDMKKACTGATVFHPMEVKFDSNGGAQLKTKQSDIDRWIQAVAEDLK